MFFSLLEPFNILLCVLQETMDGHMESRKGEKDQNLCTRSKENQENTSKHHYDCQYEISHQHTTLINSTCTDFRT